MAFPLANRLKAYEETDLYALPDEVLALRRDAVAEPQLGEADLLVRLEGDVAADHVEQEDAEGPDGGRLAPVLAETDPLRGGVDSGAWENSIVILLPLCGR